jgi:cytochrome c-type biogenesis protein CcmH/NrfG
VTSLVVIVAIAGMFAIVLFGATAPYRRETVPSLEPLADPLEDRRQSLLVSLKDLQTSRDSGAIDADEYLRLREDTETRIAKVLRAIEERNRKQEAGAQAAVERPRRSPARYLAIAMVGAIALSIGLVPSLVRSLNDRPDPSLTITVEQLQARVRQNPHDVAARLDLGHFYIDGGRLGDAFQQFTAALAIQPNNVDALANYGVLLHLSGRPLDGLEQEDKALKIQPDYGEALFYKGTILLKGLDKPAQAIVFLQRYLDGNPYGSFGDTAREQMRDARAELAGGPSATPTPGSGASPPVPTPQLTVPTG